MELPGQLQWSHENASPYVDRACGDPHVIVENDVCYNILQNMDSAGAVYGAIRLIISILKRNPDKILQVCGLSNL